MQLSIEENLKRRFKAACVMDGVNMSEIASGLFEQWLENRDRKSIEETQDKTKHKTRQKKASNSTDS